MELPYSVIILLAVLAVTLIVGLSFLAWAVAGAIVLFAFAANQGFVGIAVYVACWVFLFPVMLVASIVLGIFVLREEKSIQKEIAEQVLSERKLMLQRHPPSDPDERHKWANKLPPYDN